MAIADAAVTDVAMLAGHDRIRDAGIADVIGAERPALAGEGCDGPASALRRQLAGLQDLQKSPMHTSLMQ